MGAAGYLEAKISRTGCAWLAQASHDEVDTHIPRTSDRLLGNTSSVQIFETRIGAGMVGEGLLGFWHGIWVLSFKPKFLTVP